MHETLLSGRITCGWHVTNLTVGNVWKRTANPEDVPAHGNPHTR